MRPPWLLIRKHRKLVLLTVTTLLVSVGIVYGASLFRNNYPWAVITHYPWHRVKGYAQFYRYWQSHLRQLRFDTQSNVYSFNAQIDNALSNGDYWTAGLLEFHQGLLDRSIVDLKEADRYDEDGVFWLAMAHFRRGMNARCLTRSLVASQPTSVSPQCALPFKLNPKTINDDLERATALFQTLADKNSVHSSRYLWLLNLSIMFNGGDPPSLFGHDRVPTDFAHRLTSKAKRKSTIVALDNRARELGVDKFDAGKGVAVEDFDRDGDLDIVTGGSYDPIHFYRNENGKFFSDRSVDSDLSKISGAHIITAADYNNDGWVDLFVSHPTGTHAYGAFSLFRNDSGTGFTDVTFETGLVDKEKMLNRGAYTWTSAWGDIDNDGDLDLFIANWGGKHLIDGKPALDSSLYLNNGGYFTDITEAFGLAAHLQNNLIVGAAFGDYDNDGFTDLALASMLPGFPVLFKNINGKRFESKQQVKTDHDGGFTIAMVDLNHDGRLDIFRGVALLPDINIDGLSADNKRLDHGHSLVWLQQENGRFHLDENFFRTDWPMASMGANFGDLNNDGAYDFYLGSGGPQPWFLVPNVLYLGGTEGSRPNNRLKNISLTNGVGTLAKGHGIVFFDYDNDGDQDIYSSLGGMWPGDRWPNELFVNNTESDNNWVKIRLRGSCANYYGLGAMIRVRGENGTGESITRYYHMDNKTGFGSAPYIAHIGLGKANTIIETSVRWPGEKHYRNYSVSINSFNVIEQTP